jgi:predicted nuclease of restriction endonuclease-like RecB superfamily
MLSPEHVRVRRQGKELKLLSLGGELRQRAVELAALVLEAAGASIGESRDDLHAEWSAIGVAPREKRLLSGLQKLVEDACDFDVPDGVEAADVRRDVFMRAAEVRRAGTFDRAAVLAEVAAARGLAASELDAALFADLRGAQRLVACRAPSAEALVKEYEHAQIQAILLRAVRVVCDVRCASADGYRELFQKLKFRRLMHRISELPEGGYRLEIDGPFSLFQSVAKYGLELALMLPSLEAAADSLELVADVRWGERGMLEFRHSATRAEKRSEAAPVRSEVEELSAALVAAESGWDVLPSRRVLDLPGLGVCVPDLVLRRRSDGEEVLVELLGFWSRDGVWKRVELAQRGLGARLLFVVNARLRVSEEVLDETSAAMLYVWKTRINPSALLRRVDELAAVPLPRPRSA